LELDIFVYVRCLFLYFMGSVSVHCIVYTLNLRLPRIVTR
jgi:hypothetical protein